MRNVRARRRHNGTEPRCRNAETFDVGKICAPSAIQNHKNSLTNGNESKSKFGELRHVVHREQLDIIIFVESKLDEQKITDSKIRGFGAPVARRDRTTHGGGVLIWCKKGIAPQDLEGWE